MLHTQTLKIKKLWNKLDSDRKNMKIAYEFGIEVKKAKDYFDGTEWKKYLTNTCGVHYKTATRCKRIVKFLTDQEIIDAGSINAAYERCRGK